MTPPPDPPRDPGAVKRAPPEAAGTEPRSALRRPGRFRRWLLRPLVWLLVAAVVALLGARLLLDTRTARAWMRERAAAAATAYLGRAVEIDRLEVSLVPPEVAASGLAVAGPRPGDPPVLTADGARVVFDLSAWRDRRLLLRRLEVDRPRLFIELADDGTSNLPKLRRRGGGRGLIQVRLGTLVVRDGEVEIEERRFPLSLAARDVRGQAEGVAGAGGGVEIQAQVSASEVEALLPQGRPYLGTVSAHLRAGRGRLALQSGRLEGPDLTADFGGELAWGGGREDRRLTLDLEVAGAARLADRLGYLEGQVAGPFRFSGGFEWQPEDWSFEGRLTAPALDLMGRMVTGLDGTLSGDREAIRLGIASARYAGGALAGRLRVETASPQRPVTVELSLDDAELVVLARDQAIPLPDVAGRVDGTATYAFAGRTPLAGSGVADLVIRPAPGGLLPGFEGAVPIAIRAGTIDVEGARFRAPEQEMTLDGSYALEQRRGQFDWTVRSGRIVDLLPLLPIEAEPPDAPGGGAPAETGEAALPWLPTAGAGDAGGRLTIAPGAVATTVRLDLREVQAPGADADRVQGSFTVRESGIEELRLELAKDAATLAVSGSVPFGEGAEAQQAGLPFDLLVDAAGWPLADAPAWLPFPLPATGALYGRLELGGALEALSGRLAAEVRPLELAGITVARGVIDLRFDPATAWLDELRLIDEGGEAHLDGTLPLGEADGRELALTFGSDRLDLDLPPLAALAGGVEGTLEILGQIEGTLERPELVVQLEGRDLAVGGRPLGRDGRASLLAFWDGKLVEADGSLLGLVDFAGDGRLDAEALDLTLRVAGGDLHALAEAAAGIAPEPAALPDFTGDFSGVLRLQQDFTTSAPPVGELTLDELHLAYAEHLASNLEPVVIAVEGAGEQLRMVIRSLYLGEQGGGSELFVSGSVGLGAEAPLDLRLQSALDADWAELLLPAIEVDGQLELIAAVEGTAAEPQINGQGEVRDGRAILAGFPHAVEGLTATVLFYPEQVVVDNAEAGFAGGTLRASGSIGLDSEAAAPFSYQMQLSGKDVSLRYPEGWLTQGEAELQLVSTADGRQLRGSVRLTKALYYQEVKLGIAQLLQGVFQREAVQVESTDELLSLTHLNLAVDGPDALRIRNNLADLTGDIEVAVRGSLARPVLFGTVELDAGGKLTYADNEYELERGVISFANPYRIEPVLDVVATARVDQYDIALNLAGTPERLTATFSSDPPLPDLEVLALMSTGRPASPFVSEGTGSAGTAEGSTLSAETFLAGQAAALVSSRVNVLFGLDRFRIDPLTGTSGESSSARVTVGKRLTRDVFATYSYDPSQTEAQILELEWRVSPTFTLVLTQNGDGTYAVDGRWDTRF